MKSRFSKLMLRTRLALRQNRAAIGFVVVWLLANTVMFTKVLEVGTLDAALVATCLTKMPGGWLGAYQSFTEVVVFGLVASLVLSNVTSKYQPLTTCRALAESARGHIVVIGWTNLGERIVAMATVAGRTAVVVEEDEEVVAGRIRDEEPVVIGSPRDRNALVAAGVALARVVVIADDDLENAAVACRLVRELNADCELVVRCADADVGDVLARTYRARAVSTSRLAASFIQSHAVRLRAKKVVVFGDNSVGQRVADALKVKHIATAFHSSTSETARLVEDGVPEADLVVLCDDDLGDNLIRVDRIRALNKRTRIVCRAFHEDAAEVLTRAPFECTVLSTSRHAAESLARAGVFREIGIEAPEARVTRALAVAT